MQELSSQKPEVLCGLGANVGKELEFNATSGCSANGDIKKHDRV